MKLPILKTLCVAITLVNIQAVYALEALDDEVMSETTGEGIALLPENYSVSMNGANPTTGLYTDNSGKGTYGSGYMRFIPVGPLTATATLKLYQKADLWLYGLSLGQSKKNYDATIDKDDWGVPFGAIGTAAADFGRTITSWGTAANPWLIKTVTDNTVPNFNGVAQSVTYLGLEAPLYNAAAITSLTAAEQSAYNLKLGYWTDVFTRDATVVENVYNGLNNRLRLAFTWDTFGINGSNFKIFQTLDGVTPAMGGTYVANGKTLDYGLSKSYNKTFGMAGLLRLNSGATDTRRGVVSAQTVTREIRQVNVTTSGPSPRTITLTEGALNANNDTGGIVESYRPMTNGGLDPYALFYTGSFTNGGVCTSPEANTSSGNNQFGQCLTNEGYTVRRFKAFGTNTWTPPAARSVIRLSTQEFTGGPAGLNGTPALGGANGFVPDFRANASSAEGVFFYDANINLVLGNLYQPIMLSTDGTNFSFELARIPNKPEVYKKIYTAYAGAQGTMSNDDFSALGGSTCNVHRCGTAITLDSVGYQGSTATHSSISVGSTVYNAGTNQLSAYKGVEAYGVSIGELVAGTGLSSSTSVDYYQVWNRTRTGGGSWGAWGAWSPVAPLPALTGQEHPSLNRPDPYETTFRQNFNNQVLGIQTTMPSNMATTLAAMNPPGATVSNNFGSAVIDGLLIQHLKFSTTGL